MNHIDHNPEADPRASLITALEQHEAALARGRAALEAQRAQLHGARGQLKSERARSHDLAWELEELELRLRELAAQQADASDPLREQQLTRLADRRAALEDLALKKLIREDELAAQYAAHEQALAEQERAWAEREAQLSAECERIRALLGD